jgi:hypothetical protein
MLQTTFAVLHQLLIDSGFTVRRTEKFIRFDHPETETRLLLRPYAEGEAVDAADLVAARKILDERGVMPRQEFEQRLAARPAAG